MTQAAFIPTLVGKIMTMPTAKVASAWRQIQLSDSSTAIDAIYTQWANKPISRAPEITGGRYEAYFVVIVCSLVGEAVRNGVIEPSIVSVSYVHYYADTGSFLIFVVLPYHPVGPVTTKETVLSQKRYTDASAIFHRVFFVPVVSAHSLAEIIRILNNTRQSSPVLERSHCSRSIGR